MRNLLIILTIFISVSCIKESNTSELILDVDPTTTGTIKMSDFVDSVSFIKLEYTPQSIVPRLSKIFQDDDKLIVVSRQTVYLFDKDGKFLHKFNHRGRGRGEYLALDDIDIDTDQDQIMIVDAASSKLLTYDYNGRLLSQIVKFSDERKYIRNFIMTASGDFLCSEYSHGMYEDKQVELWRVNKEGRITEDLSVSSFIHPHMEITSTLLRSFDKEIIYVSIENDEDYRYADNKLERVVKYNIDGNCAADYKGMSNTKFATDYWMKQKNLVGRSYATYANHFSFSRWSTETIGETFYTLVDLKNKTIVNGNKIDNRLANNQFVIPTFTTENRGDATDEEYEVFENNMNGIVTIAVLPDQISSKYRMQLGISDDDLLNMNPIIQLLYVK